MSTARPVVRDGGNGGRLRFGHDTCCDGGAEVGLADVLVFVSHR